MSLIDFTKNMFSKEKVLDLEKLPSMGLFYPDDFHVKIKKARKEDIIFYEHGFNKDDISLTISKLKEVVSNNITFSKGYDFDDLVSVDIVYIFIEIVKLTTNKKIGFEYFNKEKVKTKFIEFAPENFNYLEIDTKLKKAYDDKQKVFIIDNYKYSLPKIGVENSLSDFLVTKTLEGVGDEYVEKFMGFTYFVSHKKHLTTSEIENLIKIFNEDIKESEIEKVKAILDKFSKFQSYSLLSNGEKIELKGRIDLENIWR